MGSVALTFRVLGPHERGRFAPDAWGHLLSLAGTGAINAAELEHIIERALMQIDGRIALDDLKSLLEVAGLFDATSDGQQTVH
jgi:Smg protein